MDSGSKRTDRDAAARARVGPLLQAAEAARAGSPGTKLRIRAPAASQHDETGALEFAQGFATSAGTIRMRMGVIYYIWALPVEALHDPAREPLRRAMSDLTDAHGGLVPPRACSDPITLVTALNGVSDQFPNKPIQLVGAPRAAAETTSDAAHLTRAPGDVSSPPDLHESGIPKRNKTSEDDEDGSTHGKFEAVRPTFLMTLMGTLAPEMYHRHWTADGDGIPGVKILDMIKMDFPELYTRLNRCKGTPLSCFVTLVLMNKWYHREVKKRENFMDFAQRMSTQTSIPNKYLVRYVGKSMLVDRMPLMPVAPVTSLRRLYQFNNAKFKNWFENEYKAVQVANLRQSCDNMQLVIDGERMTLSQFLALLDFKFFPDNCAWTLGVSAVGPSMVLPPPISCSPPRVVREPIREPMFGMTTGLVNDEGGSAADDGAFHLDPEVQRMVDSAYAASVMENLEGSRGQTGVDHLVLSNGYSPWHAPDDCPLQYASTP